jgi:hypothetical protein
MNDLETYNILMNIKNLLTNGTFDQAVNYFNSLDDNAPNKKIKRLFVKLEDYVKLINEEIEQDKQNTFLLGQQKAFEDVLYMFEAMFEKEIKDA